MRLLKRAFSLRVLLAFVLVGVFIWNENRSPDWDFEEHYNNWSVKGLTANKSEQYICIMSLASNSDAVEIYMLLPSKSGGIKFYKQDYGTFLNTFFNIADWSKIVNGYDEVVFETETGRTNLKVSLVKKHLFKGYLEFDFEARQMESVIDIDKMLNEKFSESELAHITALFSNSNVSYSFSTVDLEKLKLNEQKVYFNTNRSDQALNRFEKCIKDFDNFRQQSEYSESS